MSLKSLFEKMGKLRGWILGFMGRWEAEHSEEWMLRALTDTAFYEVHCDIRCQIGVVILSILKSCIEFLLKMSNKPLHSYPSA